jgi:hypothetical protein
VRSTVLKSLASIQYLLQQFKVYESRYGFKNDATLSLVNVSGLKAVDSRFVAQTTRNQKQKSLKAVNRWAVFDAERMKETTERLKNLVDGLVDITDGIARLRTETRRAGDRHPALASMTSGIHIFETMDIRSIENNNTPSVCSRQIQALDLQGSVDTFFSAQSFVSRATHRSIEREPAISIPRLEGVPIPARDRSWGSQSSLGTYSSTNTSSDVSNQGTVALPWPTSSVQPTTGKHPSPWDVKGISKSSPKDFVELFPSSKPLYICHDSTTSDGEMNLRVFSDITSAGSSKAEYMSLFHLRMHDIEDRKFSLRRYFRNSGRKGCSSILSDARLRSKTRSKTRFSFSMSSKRTSRAGSTHSENDVSASETKGDMGNSKGSRTSLSSWFRRRGSRSSHASSASGNDASDCDEDDNAVNAVNVAATRVSGDKIALEFSNYSRVDVVRYSTWRIGYTFDYWGHAYEWRRTSGKNLFGQWMYWCHSFHLYRKGKDKKPIVSITPRDNKSLGSGYFTHGTWVTPSEMRFLDNDILNGSSDIAE